MNLRIFSYGGGVQSTAALVLAAQGKIDFPTFLFANVGDDSENPTTLRYVEEYAKPYAADNGIEMVEVSRTWMNGKQTTLLEYTRGKINSIPIPVYMGGGAPGRRKCTDEWKRNTIARWMRDRGATKELPAVCGLGISMDEVQRMRLDSGIAHQVLEYPLIDLRLTRSDCRNIIKDAGLPVPPKSACWFCPFKRHAQWQNMRRNEPELFERAVKLEKRINEKRDAMGKDMVFLHRSLVPLSQAVGHQYALFEDDACDGGYCFV